MSDDEQRQVLEGIARDEDAYPRDRISAVKALREMLKERGQPVEETPEDELERILTK